MFSPIQFRRLHTEDELRQELLKLETSELVKICKEYMPDPARKIYRLKNNQKIISYILYRSKKLADKGSVFIS